MQEQSVGALRQTPSDSFVAACCKVKSAQRRMFSCRGPTRNIFGPGEGLVSPVGRHGADTCRRGQHWPNANDLGPNVPIPGTNPAILPRDRRSLSRFRPTWSRHLWPTHQPELTNIVQLWPMLADLGPNLADLGPNLADLGPPTLAPIRPTLANGAILAVFGRI